MILGSLASSPAHDFIATVPPEELLLLHLQGFFCGYNDIYTSELCLLLQDKLQEEGRSCSTTVEHLLLFTNLILKSVPSSGSRPPRLMAPVTSSSHDLQLRDPSLQFVYDARVEVLILVFFSLVLLVRLAKELVKLLRYLLLLRRDFAARGREPIIIPPRDAQLQAVAESTIVEIMGEY